MLSSMPQDHPASMARRTRPPLHSFVHHIHAEHSHQATLASGSENKAAARCLPDPSQLEKARHDCRSDSTCDMGLAFTPVEARAAKNATPMSDFGKIDANILEERGAFGCQSCIASQQTIIIQEVATKLDGNSPREMVVTRTELAHDRVSGTKFPVLTVGKARRRHVHLLEQLRDFG